MMDHTKRKNLFNSRDFSTWHIYETNEFLSFIKTIFFNLNSAKSQVLAPQKDNTRNVISLNRIWEFNAAWESMIQKALVQSIKVVLLTPTPDLSENILSDDAPLEKFSEMIRMLAKKYHVALVDSYAIFKKLVTDGADLKTYIAQPDHINQDGYQLVANEIGKLFRLK